MASVRLDFTPPDIQGITKLLIYESPTPTGTFSLIETITPVGSYPDYISYHTTTRALSLTDWFAIQWEDGNGAQTEMSAPIQGGTTTVVQQIVSRVMLRDPLADENITTQEAEAVIEEVFNTDPYLVDPATVTYKQRSGITYLVLARVYLSSLATAIGSSSTDSYTAGLVSQNAGTNQTQVSSGLSNIEQLIKWANQDLGLNYSVVLLLEAIDVAGLDGSWDITEFTFEALGG